MGAILVNFKFFIEESNLRRWKLHMAFFLAWLILMEMISHAKQKVRLWLLLDGARRRHKPPRGLREAGEKASWTYQYPNGFAAIEAQGHLDVRAGGLADRASAQLARWTAGGGERFVLRSVMLGCSIL